MVRFDECRHIGRIGKPHGREGALKLDLLANVETDLNIDEPVFLLFDGKPVPFFMQECNEAANPPILHFEDVQNMDEAKKLQGIEVYAPKHAIQGLPEWYGDLLSYSVHEAKVGDLGQVLEVRESGLQDLLCLNFNQKEILIPMQEELILRMDEKKKIIYMELPEGLLDLYLSDEEE